MRIYGLGFSFNPKTTSVIEAIHDAAYRYKARFGKSPTHVSLPNFITDEDATIIEMGMGLKITDKNSGSPLVVVGTDVMDK